MKGKKTPSVVKLDKMIDEILYELMGRKDALQTLNEAKVSKTKTPIKEEYGLLAYPPSYNPSLNQIRSVIREVLEDQEKHDKVGQSITQMIDTLHLRSDIGTEYKEKINELTRRLKINGFRDYSYWEIANDRQRHIFSLSLVPEGFEEGLDSIENYVDVIAFIYRFGTNAERDEAEHFNPITYERIRQLYPSWWDENYDVVNTRSITHPAEKKQKWKKDTKVIYPHSRQPPEIQAIEDEMIGQLNHDLKYGRT